MNKDSKGFTLIEVMITVAILGILAAIALPAYTDYVIRGRIPEATANMESYRALMEQYYQDTRNYADAAGACGVAETVLGAKNFDYVCTIGANNQLYTLTAAGVDGMVGYDYSITESNARATTSFAGVTSAAVCWITKKGGTC